MTSTRIPAAVEARRGLDAALAALRVGAGQTAAASPVLAGRCLFYVILLLILSALWDKVAADRLAGTLAHALPADGLALYVGVTEWITLALPSTHLRFEDDIRGGRLEPHLLRPKSYLVQALAQNVGGALVRLAALGPTGLLMLALSGRPWPPAEAFPALLIAGVLGVVVGVLLYALAGLMAFWARRVLPFQLVIQKLMFLLGGLYAPVTLYPAAMEATAKVSPFAAHLYWPAALTQEASVEVFLTGVGWQLIWIAILSAGCFALWRTGLAKILRTGGV